MKVVVNDESKKEEKIKFPCLMENELGLIVLAINNDACVILEKGGSGWRGVSYETHMSKSMAEMIPFKGTITLSND